MAIPAILQQLGKNQMIQTAAAIKQTMRTIQTAANPQAALNMMVMSNPKMKQVMDIVNQYGGDSMAALHALAKENGMDADEILNMLR